ncbi:hypothetical protein [Diaminobutyricimonas sp. LJ205]|uniref:hypothetical protein n=1 Tax=Diaminobutyricimonas sp. LJ205 TaxID=2683590 RepID=UPI0012F48DF3|nr:hypothetical protein [Diaminobutyricimonas sp. LJ205]
MNIIESDVQRVLAYIASLNERGYQPSLVEVDEYGLAPDRLRGDGYIEPGLFLDLLQSEREQSEEYSSYLHRLGWIAAEGNGVSLTPAGRATLAAAPKGDTTEDSAAIEAVVDPSDAFAYARLISHVGRLADSLLIDPYIDPDQLMWLTRLPRLSRVLTSLPTRNATDRETRRTEMLAVLAARRPGPNVRVLEGGELHDRVVIPAVGSALMLSTSLNSITRRLSVITSVGPDTSDALRRHYEALWQTSVPLSEQ